MAFATDAGVQALVNNSPDLDSTTLAKAKSFGDRQAINETGIPEDYSSGEQNYQDIVDLAELYAAMWIWLRWHDPDGKANQFRRAATDLAARIRSGGGFESGSNPSIVMTQSEYTTSGLNDEIEPYMSELEW